MQQPRCQYVLPEDSQSQTQSGTRVALLDQCAPIRPLARRRECDPTIRHNRITVDHANSARRRFVAAGYASELTPCQFPLSAETLECVGGIDLCRRQNARPES